jgi:hypothetical protein
VPGDQGLRRTHDSCVFHCIEPGPAIFHGCHPTTPAISSMARLLVVGEPGYPKPMQEPPASVE